MNFTITKYTVRRGFAALLIFGAVTPSWRLAAYIGVFGTEVSALYLLWAHDSYTGVIVNPAVAHVFALVCLVIGAAALVLARLQP